MTLACIHHTCQARRKDGEACKRAYDCQPELWCAQFVCAPPQDRGMSCGLCKQGLIGMDSLCMSRREVGEPCTDLDVCQDSYCFKAHADMPAGVCERPREPLAACDPDTTLCEVGLTCIQQECMPAQELGGTCLVGEPQTCQSHLNCMPVMSTTLPFTPETLDIATSEPGQCVYRGRDDEPCDTTHGIRCELGWQCRDHRCTRR
jgi:hypothetical protein